MCTCVLQPVSPAGQQGPFQATTQLQARLACSGLAAVQALQALGLRFSRGGIWVQA